MILQLRRWVPHRQLVVVADYSYAALEFLYACQTMVNPVTIITRLRLDAALYDFPSPKTKGKRGPQPKKGERQEMQAQMDTLVIEPDKNLFTMTWSAV